MVNVRGQAFTLEAIAAGMLLVSGLVFALQTTAVTPLSASTSSQHIENQQQAAIDGALAATLQAGTVRPAVLDWNASSSQFHGAPANTSFYTGGPPPNAFGDSLARSFDPTSPVYNVYVTYETVDDRQKRQRLVYRGEPSDTAVSGSITVVLYDADPFYADGSPVTVRNESHTYGGETTTDLADAPVIADTVSRVRDASGDTYQRAKDYTVVDNDTDGKPDAIEWVGATPDSGETFTVNYTPAIRGADFYAPDVAASGVYNVLEVEVVLWKQ